MSHIHPDRTSSDKLSLLQRAGADPHGFLLISSTKVLPAAPSPPQPIVVRGPQQPAPCRLWFGRQLFLLRFYFSRSEWFFKPGADLCVSWTGVLPGCRQRERHKLCGVWLAAGQAALCAWIDKEPRASSSIKAPLRRAPSDSECEPFVPFHMKSANSHFMFSAFFFPVSYFISRWSEKMKHSHFQSFYSHLLVDSLPES